MSRQTSSVMLTSRSLESCTWKQDMETDDCRNFCIFQIQEQKRNNIYLFFYFLEVLFHGGWNNKLLNTRYGTYPTTELVQSSPPSPGIFADVLHLQNQTYRYRVRRAVLITACSPTCHVIYRLSPWHHMAKLKPLYKLAEWLLVTDTWSASQFERCFLFAEKEHKLFSSNRVWMPCVYLSTK
jgi:hypothetical protein